MWSLTKNALLRYETAPIPLVVVVVADSIEGAKINSLNRLIYLLRNEKKEREQRKKKRFHSRIYNTFLKRGEKC